MTSFCQNTRTEPLAEACFNKVKIILFLLLVFAVSFAEEIEEQRQF
ncbi:MAG: hypothetical protein LBC85_07140 [Fibromonadaceae bacterium]|jgi:hypothetical protein|nr:hypothetical protein [Fibromonadaceae bacterium]